MVGKKVSIGMVVSLFVLLVSASVALASSVNPSVEITGGPQAANYCAGGVITVPVYFNINGAGATSTYASVANAGIGGFGHTGWQFAHVVKQEAGVASASFNPTLNGQPYVLPANTTVYLNVDSFDGSNQQTFRASVGFNCSTGTVVSLTNQSFANPVVRIPLDGPRVVLPNEPVIMLPAVQDIIQIDPRQLNPGRP